MSDDAQEPGSAPTSIAELIERVVTTVAEIGWSLFAAGKGMAAIASRLVRLAQEQIGIGEVGRGGVRVEPAPAMPTESTAPPARPSSPTGAAALDREPVPEHLPLGQPSPPVEGALRAGTAAREEACPALPERYGADLLVVLPRDPTTAFAWWELTAETRRRVGAEVASSLERGEEPRDALLVRALDAPAAGDAGGSWPSWLVELPPLAASRYVDLPRSYRRFELTLGLLAAGRFVPLLSPATVELPADDVSSEGDVRWRVVGDPDAPYVVGFPRPREEATAELLAELRGTAASSSDAWPAGHRLLEVGASDGLPLC